MTAPLDSICGAGKTRRMAARRGPARKGGPRTIAEIADDGLGVAEVRDRVDALARMFGAALKPHTAERVIVSHLDALARWVATGGYRPAAADHLDALSLVMGVGPSPAGGARDPTTDAEVIIIAARGRLALLEGRDVHIRELAPIAGITTKSAWNHSTRGWLTITGGMVRHADALAWLERRES